MEGEDRRDRLAQLNLERMQRPPAHGWRAVAAALADSWRRFFAFAGLERTIYAGGIVIAAVAALSVAVLFLANGGGNGERLPSASLPEVSTSPTAVPALATPTTVLVGAPDLPTPEPSAEPNRGNCDAIRGTAYQSNAEREWFIANCSTPDSPAKPPAPRVTAPPAPGEPTSTPTPAPTGITSGEAVVLASEWIPQHTQYTTTGSCTAVRIGDHWVVTCQGTPAGCGSEACQASISVCVYADPTRVVPSAQC